MRIPKQLKLAHTDKIPQIMLKNAEKSDDFVKQEILNHKVIAFEKHGNRSRVGVLISMDNLDPLGKRMFLDKDEFKRRVYTR